MRMEVAIEPYEIEVEQFDHWDGYREVMAKKKITIDKKTVFVRMV